MTNIKLILTADYEVFGNGSGSVPSCLINPSKELIDVCDQFDVPVTFFVDVCELWAFEEVEKNGIWDLDYSPSNLILNQIKEAFENGHDVQLHFHPQWLDYEYLGKGKWNLNHDLWRISSLTKSELQQLFKRGKEYLEQLLKPIDNSYVCNVFRAGGWCIQPEENVLEAMIFNGFKIDSTVAPNSFNLSKELFFDFRGSPKKALWNIKNDVLKEEEGELIEIPIYSVELRGMRKLDLLSRRFLKGISLKPKDCDGRALNSAKRTKYNKLKDILSKSHVMFNFSDATSSYEMKYFLKRALKKYKGFDGDVPIVMIGHPKSFANKNELKEFIFWCSEKSNISFTTYNYYLNEYQSIS